jgi:2-hydroxy-3-oxopropionate reductase
MSERIGFIGLGIMGKPMARNLLKSGYQVTVFNRSQPAIDELVAAGAASATSPRDVAERSDVVITMLPDGPDVEAVMLGSDGILAGAREGVLVIDMSTIAPVVARRLAEEAQQQGVHMLDAPVSGGDQGAISGTLSIMAGGAAEDFERARPIFEVLGKTITHCGPTGAGQMVKACNQIVVAVIIEAVSEALVLGSKSGVDPATILQVLGGGLAQNRVMELRGPNMIQHVFEPGAKAKLHRKDLGIVLQTAREYGVVLPVTALVDQMFTTLVEAGRGEWDHSALLTVIEDLSKHSLVTSESPS